MHAWTKVLRFTLNGKSKIWTTSYTFQNLEKFDSDDVWISWTFSVFRKCILLCSDSMVKVLHGRLRNFGWTNRDQESRIRFQKKSLAIVSLSQWQHLSRHSHSECSAWRSWILQSENSRIQNQDIWTHAWLALVSSSKKTWNDFEFGALSCRREEWSLLSLKWNYPRPFLTRTNSSWTHSAT